MGRAAVRVEARESVNGEQSHWQQISGCWLTPLNPLANEQN